MSSRALRLLISLLLLVAAVAAASKVAKHDEYGHGDDEEDIDSLIESMEKYGMGDFEEDDEDDDDDEYEVNSSSSSDTPPSSQSNHSSPSPTSTTTGGTSSSSGGDEVNVDDTDGGISRVKHRFTVVANENLQCIFLSLPVRGHYDVAYRASARHKGDSNNVHVELFSKSKFRKYSSQEKFSFKSGQRLTKLCYSTVEPESKRRPHTGKFVNIEFNLYSYAPKTDVLMKSITTRKTHLLKLEGMLRKISDRKEKFNVMKQQLKRTIENTENTVLLITAITQFMVLWNTGYFVYSFFNMFRRRLVC